MKKLFQTVLKWVANENVYDPKSPQPDEIDWLRALPFIALNLSCLLVFYFGFSWTAFITATVLYFVRLFSIGAFYHRYFSHKTYQTTRFWQFIFAMITGTCAQRGPLWWVSHHRQHHMVADEPADAHSPVQHGFLWSHVGWFLSKRNYNYNPERVKDLAAFPELVFLDRFDLLMPGVLFISLLVSGLLLHRYAPQLGTGACQMLVWGFSISTVAVFNSTVLINSLSHVTGSRRYNTKDNSRNNILFAFLTLGEGWHNNHHHYPATARQGFMWWEIDVTYYIIKLFEKLGMVWDVRGVPKAVLAKNLIRNIQQETQPKTEEAAATN
jgi:stearoyl-CoA desaturase (delta-9 desaturase)